MLEPCGGPVRVAGTGRTRDPTRPTHDAGVAPHSPTDEHRSISTAQQIWYGCPAECGQQRRGFPSNSAARALKRPHAVDRAGTNANVPTPTRAVWRAATKPR